jgi:hypothetical protein
MCNKSKESIDHLFLYCDVVRDLWNSLFNLFGVEWVMRHLCLERKEKKCSRFTQSTNKGCLMQHALHVMEMLNHPEGFSFRILLISIVRRIMCTLA